jgi:hypothetical protein
MPGAFENHIVTVFHLVEKPSIPEVASISFCIGEDREETIDPRITNRLDRFDVQGVRHRLKSSRVFAVGEDIIIGFDSKPSGQSLPEEPSIPVEEDLHIERQMGRKANRDRSPGRIDQVEIEVIDEALFAGDVAMLRIAMVLGLPTGKGVGHLSGFHNQIDADKVGILREILLGDFILFLIAVCRKNRNMVFFGKLLGIEMKLRRKGLKPRFV